MKIRMFICFSTSLLLCVNCARNNISRLSSTVEYASVVKSAIGVLKWDLEGFYFRSIPIGNFGVGTMYLNESNSTDPHVIESHWLLSNPSIWFEDTLPNWEKQKILDRVILKGGYGNIDFSDSLGKKINTKLNLSLFNSLGIEGELNTEKGVKITLSAEQALLRKLAWLEFQKAVRDHKFTPTVENVIKQQNYTIAASDVILTKYKITIEVNKSVNPQLDTKLSKAIGKAIGQGGNGSMVLNKVRNGKYQLEAKDDMVAAIQFKLPPKVIDRGPISDWENANIDESEILRLESLLAHPPKD